MKNFKFLLLLFLLIWYVPQAFTQNKALDFSGNDRVTIPSFNILGFTEVTVEAWINLDNYLGGIYTASGSPVVMQKTDPAIGPHNDYGIILMVLSETHYQDHGKQVAFGLNFGPNGIYHVGLHSGDTVNLNTWHHVAGTYDGTSMYVYIDGVLRKSFNVVDSLGSVSLYSPDNGTYLGYRDEGQFGKFDGRIDEIRIWNYCRSEAQIRSTMHQELTGNETGIHALWNFNESSGQDIYDSGPQGWDGYMGPTTSTEFTDPSRVSSTAPVPYYTIADGNYDSAWVWASGQLAPVNDWAQIKINDNVNLASDETLLNITVSTAGAFTIDNGYTLSINGDFLIASDNTGTGSFIDNGNITYSGATAQRYLSEDQWHYVSTPVAGALSGVFSNIYLRSWDEPSESWSYITSTATSLNAMEGYAAWASTAYTGATTVEYSGLFNTGNYSVALSNTAGTSALPGEDPSGYNFIGNPYPSGIDWDGAGWTKTNVDDAIYMITYIAGNRQYASYVDGVGTHGASNEIAPHQGFFVKCNDVLGGNIQVSNNARIHTSQVFFKNGLSNDQYLKLIVRDANGLYDETVIRAKEGASAMFDSSLDALKMKGSNTIPQVYTGFEEETIYSINTLGTINSTTVIPVFFEAGMDGIYELSFKEKDGLKMFPLLLYDKKEGVLYDLRTFGTYKFIASAADDKNRFELRFAQYEGNPQATLYADALVMVKNEQVIVNLEESTYGEAKVFDLSGRLIAKANLSKGINSMDVNSNPGYYLVEIITPLSTTTRKIFLK